MAEDIGDKTEAPTPRRREEAREEGNVARSSDLTAAAILIGSLLMLNWYGGNLFAAMSVVVRQMLGGDAFAGTDSHSATAGAVASVLLIGRALMPLFGGVMLIAIVVNIAQVGFHLNVKKLQPNFGALNPLRGFGRLFQARGAMQLLMGVLKMTLVGVTAYSAIHTRMGQIVSAGQMSGMQAFHLGGQVIYSIGMRVGILLLVLAIFDYAWQRWQMEQSLKMTKQEVKDEMRRMDGDPKIKQRRRQIAQQMAQKKLKKDVPTADVVITNPTEFAVALKYDAATMHAPRVVAKGRDLIAKRIREIAIEAGIPILERKPLARALYKLVDVGHEVPEEFYSTIAEILAYVYELTGKVRARQTA